MKTNVKNYTSTQLLDRVKSLDSFAYIPKEHWLIGVRSEEDETNKFDDKFYHFYEERFIGVYSGTTHTGIKGLVDFETYNKLGAAILKSDTIVYDSHRRGLSKDTMVYRQHKSFPYYRDNNKNGKVEEIGQLYSDMIHAHIHDVKLGNVDVSKEDINGWSLACQVFNNGKQWHEFFDVHTIGQEFMTLCILKEF